MVRRQLYMSDAHLRDYEQNADGPTEVQFDDGSLLYFFAVTEINSIGVQDGKMPPYGESYELHDVSNNTFWRKRVGCPIQRIEILQSQYASLENPSEFAIEFSLTNGLRICFEYLDEEEFPDMVRVTEGYLGPLCSHIDVSKP